MEQEVTAEDQSSINVLPANENPQVAENTLSPCENIQRISPLSRIPRWFDRAKSRALTFFGADTDPTIKVNEREKNALPKWEPSSSYRRTDFFTEINDTLKWIQDRAAALGVLGFGLANWLWFDFVSYYNIPIGIFSPALLSALPSILASVVVIVLMLSAGALTPAIVLCTPLYKSGPALIDFHGRTTVDGGSQKAVDAWNRWLLLSLLSTILWPLAFVSSALLSKSNDSTALGVTMLATLFATIVGGSWFLTRGTPPEKSSDFWMTAILGLLLQNYLLLVAMLAALSFVDQMTWKAAALPIAAYLAIATFTSFAQCIGASIRRKQGFQRGVLARALVVSGISLWILALFPIIGGPLASLPIRVTSSGARACIVMSLRNDSTKPFDPQFLAQGQGGVNPESNDKSSTSIVRSKELSMAPLLDGTYYLKLRNADNGEFFLVSKDAVSAIEGCPKPVKAQKSTQHTEQKPTTTKDSSKQPADHSQSQTSRGLI